MERKTFQIPNITEFSLDSESRSADLGSDELQKYGPDSVGVQKQNGEAGSVRTSGSALKGAVAQKLNLLLTFLQGS